jgi:hypothetical protein
MEEKSSIEPVQQGTTWPSGHSEAIATLKVDDAWVAAVTGAPLIAGDEDGLGRWVGSGGKLPSGACVELLRYELGGPHFILNTDAGANIRDTFDEFMTVTGLPMNAVNWRHPKA